MSNDILRDWQDRERTKLGLYIQKEIFVEVRSTVYKRPDLPPFLALTRRRSSTDYWVVGNVEEVDKLLTKLQAARSLLVAVEKETSNEYKEKMENG